MQADVAQLVEQLIRNQQVVSSSLTVGSRFRAENNAFDGMTSRRREVIFVAAEFTKSQILTQRSICSYCYCACACT